MSDLPSGTVTFLFTDIEGSTPLSQRYPDEFPVALARHHAILNDAIRTHGGQVFQIVGDAFCAAFRSARDALDAALAAQRALQTADPHPDAGSGQAAALDHPSLVAGGAASGPETEDGRPQTVDRRREKVQQAPVSRAEPAPSAAWGSTLVLHVRMGIHSGEASPGDMDARAGGYSGYLTLTRVQRVMSTAYGGQVLLSNASAELLVGQLPDGISLRDMGEHHLKGIAGTERLWQVVAPDLRQDFPPSPSLATIPNNIPVQLTSFVGREHEVDEVKQLLAKTRLLTVTGPGGMGKTRLSLQVAAGTMDAFKDGVWFIELGPLADPALVAITTAVALGVREEQARPLLATLTDWLRDKRLLVILDNCEHLIDACAEFADAVLRAGAETRMLATSREPLGVAGESVYRIPGLETPNPGEPLALDEYLRYAAVRLFVERATQVRHHFQLTSANAPVVAQICRRLDGIPLAIELAAARVKALRVEQIAARLDDRFQLLTGGSRTALPRQQTLRALIDWSYSLLNEPERVMLRRLSTFAGGWTLEAAESVCGESADGVASDADEPIVTEEDEHEQTVNVLDLLTRLVDKSLVVMDEQGEAPRFEMLETIREYAREKLREASERERMHDRHLSYFIQLAEHVEPRLHGAERAEWLPRLQAEHDNLRSALEWACGRDRESARWLAGVLYWFWHYGDDLSEPRTWYARVLEGDGHEAPTRGLALALMGSGLVSTRLYYAGEAQSPLERSVALWQQLGEPRRLAWSLWALARMLVYRGQSARASALYAEHEALFRACGNGMLLTGALSYWGRALTELRHDDPAAKARLDEALAIGRTLQDPHGLYVCYMNLGHWALAQGDYGAARRHYMDSLLWRRRLGTRWLIALGLREVAHVLCLEDDYREAERVYTEALGLVRALGDQRGAASIEQALADVAQHLGDAARAHSLLTDTLARFCSWGDALCMANGLRVFADLRQDEGSSDGAARLLGFVNGWLQANRLRLVLFDRVQYERSVTRARTQLSAAEFDGAWEAGGRMTLDEAMAYAGIPL